jgi:Domain of unknown function (DUF4288)
MWFTASLLYKSRHPDHPQSEFLWEESIVLIRASSEEEARREAERIGKDGEHDYVAAAGNLVHWTFEQVESVQAILDDALNHGTEVFSRFLRASEVESLLAPFKD